jgi:hypothetical protein
MKKIIRVILPPLIILIILEFGFRVWDTLTGQIITNELRQLLYTEKATDHPFLDYTSKNNFDGLVSFIEWGGKFFVSTNSYGFRTKEFFPKLPGSCRVIIMGDSFIYGNNVSQEGTVAVQLERLLRENISPGIEVFSLGVPSYSGVQYSVLADMYFDLLQPDIVIVAVDQGDFEEDKERIDQYVLHRDGTPYFLKDAESRIKGRERKLVIAADGEIKVAAASKANWELRLTTGFSLYKYLKKIADIFKNLPRRDQPPDPPVVTYEALVEEHGPDLSGYDFGWLETDIIMYDYQTALKRYQPTFICLKHIADMCREKKIKLFLASYPYPWMVSIDQAIPYQYYHCKGKRYDFRGNRGHPRLMDSFARDLEVPHINTYPLFENSTEKNYGDYDPHMNQNGYRLLTEGIYQAIESDLRQVCAGKIMGKQ